MLNASSHPFGLTPTGASPSMPNDTEIGSRKAALRLNLEIRLERLEEILETAANAAPSTLAGEGVVYPTPGRPTPHMVQQATLEREQIQQILSDARAFERFFERTDRAARQANEPLSLTSMRLLKEIEHSNSASPKRSPRELPTQPRSRRHPR
jgi:hypothetical protein